MRAIVTFVDVEDVVLLRQILLRPILLRHVILLRQILLRPILLRHVILRRAMAFARTERFIW
jgi:hypothetical protein